VKQFRLGPYEILEPLGHGGMGAVYRARQEPFGRVVALKLLRTAGAADADSQRRFAREIELAAGFSHPHLVKVLDGGQIDGTAYIAMEVVEGGTLATVMTAHPVLRWTHAAALVSRLADALGYLHDHDILHRDVKPTNALLSRDGWLKLVDFGLARPNEATVMTADGALVGTLQFMAPEVASGERAGKSADLWSAGCILYRMLTGRSHVVADTQAEWLRKLVSEPVVPPGPIDPEIPAPLAELTMELLAKDPEARSSDAHAVAARLDDLLAELEGVTWDQVLTPAETEMLLGESVAPPPLPTPKPARRAAASRAITSPTPKPPAREERSRAMPIAAGVACVVLLAAWGLASRGTAPAPVASIVASPSAVAAGAPSPSPSAAPLSYTRSLAELVRFLPRLKAGGGAAERALDEMRQVATVWISDKPCGWIYWLSVEQWFADPRRTLTPPRSPCGESGNMDIVEERVFLRIVLKSDLMMPESAVVSITLAELSRYPDDGKLWLTLGRLLELEARVPEARLAYAHGLTLMKGQEMPEKADTLWVALSRALIATPGYDVERDWWTFMQDGKEGRRRLKALGEALASEPAGFDRFERILRKAMSDNRFRADAVASLANHLEHVRFKPSEARKEMKAYLEHRPEAEDVVSDRYFRHLIERGRVAEAYGAMPRLVPARPLYRYMIECLTAPPKQPPRPPTEVGLEKAREYQGHFEAFRLMELGSWGEAAREAAAAWSRSSDGRERARLVALDLLGRPDPTEWVRQTGQDVLMKFKDPVAFREAPGALATPLGVPYMERFLAGPAGVDRRASMWRALWLSRRGDLAGALALRDDAYRATEKGEASDVMELILRPLWLEAAGQPVDAKVLEGARAPLPGPHSEERAYKIWRKLAEGDAPGALNAAWRYHDMVPTRPGTLLAAMWLQAAVGKPGDWPMRHAQLLACLRMRGHGAWLLDELRRADAVGSARARKAAAAAPAMPSPAR
jgi:serine/threonine protein kinase